MGFVNVKIKWFEINIQDVILVKNNKKERRVFVSSIKMDFKKMKSVVSGYYIDDLTNFNKVYRSLDCIKKEILRS